MVRRMSGERREVLALLEERGAMSPSAVASVLQKHPSSVRRLLFGMLSDGQLISPEKGLYGVPEGESNPESEHPTNQGEHLPDEGEHPEQTGDHVAEGGEFPKEPEILEDSPSGIFAFSAERGGMIANESLRKSKGYR
jgi:hypothetical protein